VTERTGLRYYFSGLFPQHKENDYMHIITRPTNRLFSCHKGYYKAAVHSLDMLAREVPKHTEILLDSGAFTAWTKEEEVSISELIEVYSGLIDKYETSMYKIWLINLDRIPGTVKRAATPTEMEDAKKESMANFHILEKVFGSRVLPVFHQGESWDYLKEVSQVNQYICLSPQNNIHEVQRVKWSEETHKRIDNRTHGLATTGTKMILRNPWHSVDSASWLRQSATGKIMLNSKGRLRPIVISSKSPTLQRGGHFHHLSTHVKDDIVSRLEKYGVTLEQAQTEVYARMAVTMGETFEWSKTVCKSETSKRSHMFSKFVKPHKSKRTILQRR